MNKTDKLAIKIEPNSISESSSFYSQLREILPKQIVTKQQSFDGIEIIAVIISTSAIYLDKILSFIIQNRKNIKRATLKVKQDEIFLSGFSSEEIKEIIDSGSIEYFQKILDDNEEKSES